MRVGAEVALAWLQNQKLAADLEASYIRAKCTDGDPAGPEIPGSVPLVLSADVVAKSDNGWLASARFRHFGRYALIEDNSVRSKATGTVNARLGYKFSPKLRLAFEVYNLTNRRDAAIDYAYESRLPGEAAEGKFDVHFHPIESRSVRANLIANF